VLESNRRSFLLGLTTIASTSNAQPSAVQVDQSRANSLKNASIASDQKYWQSVRDMYRVSNVPINLENGFWGVMAEPVRAEYLSNINRINLDNSVYARTQFGKDAEAVRNLVSTAVGAKTSEIAFTRGATEALQLIIAGYNKLSHGATVLYSDLDYDSMQYAMNWLADRRGAKVVKFSIPEPATKLNVLHAYKEALEQNPGTALLLLTHVSHRTGLVMPVSEIAAMARKRGVDVVLDAAHSWGQIDFKVSDLGVDFIGFNLHKWIGAPLGVGFMYIAQSRLKDIDRAMADEDWPVDDIRSRVHTGTSNFASLLTVPSALSLHAQIGSYAKEMRLRHLRNYWVSELRKEKNIEILTPDDAAMVAGITSFRIKDRISAADNNLIVSELRDRYGIFSVRRSGVAKGQCVRISPALFTTESDLDRLIFALKSMAS
jgi:isopenicillin-N epimerase